MGYTFSSGIELENSHDPIFISRMCSLENKGGMKGYCEEWRSLNSSVHNAGRWWHRTKHLVAESYSAHIVKKGSSYRAANQNLESSVCIPLHLNHQRLRSLTHALQSSWGQGVHKIPTATRLRKVSFHKVLHTHVCGNQIQCQLVKDRQCHLRPKVSLLLHISFMYLPQS